MAHSTGMFSRLFVFLAGVLVSLACFAGNEKITGVFAAGGTASGSGFAQVNFTCFGSPACTGIYSGVAQDEGCTNTFPISGVFTVTGLDLSHPGATFSGTLDLENDWSSNGPTIIGAPPIVCAYAVRNRPVSIPYNGTWTGSSGTISYTGTFPVTGDPIVVAGAFYAEVSTTPPVFPLTVTGTITPAVANIQAQVQFRPQDVGTSASVFVFALAPASIVRSAAKAMHFGLMARETPKDAPVPCVLAQVGSDGLLHAVPSASNLVGTASAVLTAQGASVNVLNNIATPNVAGATMFVGYGPDPNTMVNNGVNQAAITVPGTATCVPKPPQTGWWWNPLEGGRGFSIEVQGNNLFFAAFHYEANGAATWNVSPGPISLGGSRFTSDFYGVTGGQTLFSAYKPANAAKAGTITLSFSDASHGTMTWPGGTVPIERMNLVPGGLAAVPAGNQPETGWWWNPDENGRGFFIEWQKGYADLAGYMYDDAGKPVWYIAVYETPNARAFNGNWWTFANGQSMGGAYKPATRTSDSFAPVSINFTGADTAIMTLPNGRTTNLVRQRF
ncbi:MAG: hypothetical protein ABI789_06405 [Usitatibacter sp.]